MERTRSRTNIALGLAVVAALLMAAPIAAASGPRTALSEPIVVASITVGTNPGYNHYDAARGETYVSNVGSSNVSVISDTSLSVVATVAVGSSPKGLDYDPTSGTIWVANSGGTSISVVSDQSNAVIGAVSGLSSPTRPEWDPINGTMWVTENLTAGKVVVVNASTYATITTLRAGTNTVGITHDPARHAMLVGNYGSGNVTVFNVTTYAKIATVATGTHPEAIACYDGAGIGECAVAGIATNTLYLVNDTTWTVSQTVTVGAGPIGVQADSATRAFYVTCADAAVVDVVPMITNAVAYILPVGSLPHGITSYDPVRGLLFASNQGSNNVSVISDGSGGTGGGGGGISIATSTDALIAGVVCIALVLVTLAVLANATGGRKP